MSVNISSKQFAKPDLVRRIDDILRECELEPRRLKLEITESVLMANTETAAALLSDIQARGIPLSIDDFGTGYSSLSYLHRFPLHTLKIDRSFVSRMGGEGGDGENLEIVRAIVSLACSLRIDVVAEGVETAEQLALLRSLGCKYGQGFFFSAPVDREAARSLLTREAREQAA